MQKGLLILYTGHGKGKTTAAFGMAYRAMGRGWRVAVVQYIKGKWMTGERLFSKEMDRLELHVMGEGFTWESEDISRDQAAASRAWARSVELIQSGDYPLVILDEFTYALHYGWLDLEQVRAALAARPEPVTVVITGRHAPEGLIEDADLVTDMNVIKHPYGQGRGAVPGIDY